MACSCTQNVIVIKGDQVKDNILNGGVGRADKRFRTSGTLLTMKPDDRSSWFFFHGSNNAWHHRGREAEIDRGKRAELQKIPAAYTTGLEYIGKGLIALHFTSVL